MPLAHASVTSVLYAPPCGVTVTTCVLVCPAASETLDGETSTAKSVTTICRSAASEKLSPLLLAGWAVLYGWMIFNPAVAGATHVNGTVVLLWLLGAFVAPFGGDLIHLLLVIILVVVVLRLGHRRLVYA